MALEKLRDVTVLAVRQQTEWVEALASFETQNRYAVLDGAGRELFYAAEHSGLLGWWTLQSHRPFTVDVLDREGRPVLVLRRPFRLYFHELEVRDGEGRLLGAVRRRSRVFALLRRIYSVCDADGRETLALFGPVLHPWTFRIMADATETGRITKQWSGVGKEMFTDADHFGVELPADAEPNVKAVLLAAVFLIDFVHFERASRH